MVIHGDAACERVVADGSLVLSCTVKHLRGRIGRWHGGHIFEGAGRQATGGISAPWKPRVCQRVSVQVLLVSTGCSAFSDTAWDPEMPCLVVYVSGFRVSSHQRVWLSDYAPT
eukprot:3527677-Rhodomonas_salina.7